VRARQSLWRGGHEWKKKLNSLGDVGGQTSQLQAAAWTNPATHSLAALRQPGDEPNINTFTGKIVSQNGVRYILRDEANDTWYHLDDQQQAGKFFGKTVVVTGTLDGRSDTIHIRTISESKS
jgi:NAD-dependent DNA ligase